MELTTEDKVRSLFRADTYDQPVNNIDAIQTHFAWIFLTDRHAYKMKKPMRAPGIDLTELETRHQNCLAELRLNRRLAPAVYLEVVPLTLDEEGTVRIHGRGRAIEWLVKMQRLPHENDGTIIGAQAQRTASASEPRGTTCASQRIRRLLPDIQVERDWIFSPN